MENNELENNAMAGLEQIMNELNRTSNWRERLEAVEKSGEWNNKQIIDALTHRMNNDTVYQVQEAAYKMLLQLGEEVQPPVKKKGELNKGVTKILVRIKKSLPEGHSIEDFKQKFKKMRLDVYDVCEGEKGADFDQWLENEWAAISTSRMRPN